MKKKVRGCRAGPKRATRYLLAFRGRITSRSSRRGALNDSAHAVAQSALPSIRQTTLVIHSREDNSVPFAHAEWALKNIPNSELCEAGFTGHFFWVGPDCARISQTMVQFLRASANIQA